MSAEPIKVSLIFECEVCTPFPLNAHFKTSQLSVVSGFEVFCISRIHDKKLHIFSSCLACQIGSESG